MGLALIGIHGQDRAVVQGLCYRLGVTLTAVEDFSGGWARQLHHGFHDKADDLYIICPQQQPSGSGSSSGQKAHEPLDLTALLHDRISLLSLLLTSGLVMVLLGHTEEDTHQFINMMKTLQEVKDLISKRVVSEASARNPESDLGLQVLQEVLQRPPPPLWLIQQVECVGMGPRATEVPWQKLRELMDQVLEIGDGRSPLFSPPVKIFQWANGRTARAVKEVVLSALAGPQDAPGPTAASQHLLQLQSLLADVKAGVLALHRTNADGSLGMNNGATLVGQEPYHRVLDTLAQGVTDADEWLDISGQEGGLADNLKGSLRTAVRRGMDRLIERCIPMYYQSRSACVKGLAQALGAYLQGLPPRYGEARHGAAVQKALQQYQSVAHGSARARLEAELLRRCEAVWRADRQRCAVVSLTGRCCIKDPKHVGRRADDAESKHPITSDSDDQNPISNDEGGKISSDHRDCAVGEDCSGGLTGETSAAVDPHDSGVTFPAASPSGRSLTSLPDPFTFEGANVRPAREEQRRLTASGDDCAAIESKLVDVVVVVQEEEEERQLQEGKKEGVRKKLCSQAEFIVPQWVSTWTLGPATSYLPSPFPTSAQPPLSIPLDLPNLTAPHHQLARLMVTTTTTATSTGPMKRMGKEEKDTVELDAAEFPSLSEAMAARPAGARHSAAPTGTRAAPGKREPTADVATGVELDEERLVKAWKDCLHDVSHVDLHLNGGLATTRQAGANRISGKEGTRRRGRHRKPDKDIGGSSGDNLQEEVLATLYVGIEYENRLGQRFVATGQHMKLLVDSPPPASHTSLSRPQAASRPLASGPSAPGQSSVQGSRTGTKASSVPASSSTGPVIAAVAAATAGLVPRSSHGVPDTWQLLREDLPVFLDRGPGDREEVKVLSRGEDPHLVEEDTHQLPAHVYQLRRILVVTPAGPLKFMLDPVIRIAPRQDPAASKYMSAGEREGNISEGSTRPSSQGRQILYKLCQPQVLAPSTLCVLTLPWMYGVPHSPARGLGTEDVIPPDGGIVDYEGPGQGNVNRLHLQQDAALPMSARPGSGGLPPPNAGRSPGTTPHIVLVEAKHQEGSPHLCAMEVVVPRVAGGDSEVVLLKESWLQPWQSAEAVGQGMSGNTS